MAKLSHPISSARKNQQQRSSRNIIWGFFALLSTIAAVLCVLNVKLFITTSYKHDDLQLSKAANSNENITTTMAATTKSLPKHHNITTATTTKSLPKYQSARQQEQNLWNSLPKDLPKGTMTAHCRPFKCTKDESTCDNIHPTNYDGPNPPCCTHILRDLVQVFDETMSTLNLDYVVSFGTLLGLARSDRIIPWTGDNDIIIRDATTAKTMVHLWNTTDAYKKGLNLLLEGILRLCITPKFAQGKIEQWLDKGRKNCRGWLYSCEVPYIDFYVGKNISDNQYGEEDEIWYNEVGECKHYYKDVFPSQRRTVYNGTFSVNVPANPEQLLRTYYGIDWATPPEMKDAHGLGWKIGECPYGPSHSSANVQIVSKHLEETKK